MDDGGPAFPYPAATAEGYPGQHAHPGMNLRDWFAGQALAGLCASTWGLVVCTTEGIHENLVAVAYRIADKAMEHRSSPPHGA